MRKGVNKGVNRGVNKASYAHHLECRREVEVPVKEAKQWAR